MAAHEKGMREQAKKMNVASLRSSEAANTSAECKLAKVLQSILMDVTTVIRFGMVLWIYIVHTHTYSRP